MPARALQKAVTLQCVLRAVNARSKAQISGHVGSELDGNWRYLQQFLAPEWLMHLSKEPAWTPGPGVMPGMMVSSNQFIVMDVTEENVTSWLDENRGLSPAEVDEAFDLIQSHLYSVIQSQGGRQKAQRLLTQLRQMSSAVSR